MNKIETKLVSVISDGVKKTFDLDSVEGLVMVEIPRDNANGDYSSNIAMRLAKLLKKKPEAIWVTVLAKIGEYSMDIMTLHFVFFKLVDYIWFKCFNVDEQFALNTFPHSFKTEWSNIVYSIVGIIGPILVRMTLDFGKKQVIKVYLRKEVKES